MIGKRHKVKKAGDERLLKVVAQLQRQLFDQTTIDYSFDNRVLNKILHAKFIFLYEEARRRNTKSSSSSSVITR